jgi:outer membrane biosynthesis protein TonB
MNMYLALILGLFALAFPSSGARVIGAEFLQTGQESQPQAEAPQSGPAQTPSQDAPAATHETPPAGAEQTPPTATQETSPEPQGKPPDTASKPELKPGPQAKTSSKKRRHKRPATKSSNSTPEKKVVRNGGTADPAVQLAPGVSNEQASRQRQSTTQLLSATDANLKQISVDRLSPSQQASVSQIRKYMEQAKAAEAAGDLQRAQNLASKARLLSDDLVKH